MPALEAKVRTVSQWVHAKMKTTFILVICVAVSLCSGQDETFINEAESENEYFEGDIILSDQQQLMVTASRTRNNNNNDEILGAIQNAVLVDLPDYAWTNGVVPYVLDSSVTSHAATMNVVQQAMNDYHSFTCIRFVPRTNELDYIRIFKGSGCYSNIGRIGGPQDVSIGFGCENKGTVIHEFLHALGRWHEQSRPDRDQFVTIRTNNIISGRESNFDRLDSVFYVSTQGVPYDFGSVMHYHAYAFAADRSIPTIEPKDSRISLNDLGQRSGFSDSDLAHVHNQYCGGDGGTWSAWSSFSACSRTCNGGERTRTRQCNGGSSCLGTNIETRTCNTQSCPVQATWSSWGSWSGCSQTCGRGLRTRTRQCLNGNNCEGAHTAEEFCNTQSCPIPSSWGPWGSWSSCSRTCTGGGIRYRMRSCQNGNDCSGGTGNREQERCNEGISCPVNPGSGEWGEWSSCSVTCGGGTRFRTRQCGASQCNSEAEQCNTRQCEDRLQGLVAVGCYFVPSYSYTLRILDGTDFELMDNPFNRDQPIRKCGSASLRAGHTVFGVTQGYCISGSSNVVDYQTYQTSYDYCVEGTGNYYGGRFLMDVYSIFNQNNFLDSVEDIVNGTAPTSTTTDSTAAITDANTSSGATYLPSLALFFGLLIVSLSFLL